MVRERLPRVEGAWFGALPAIDRALAGGARLVTLTGTAGVGKTRSAIEWARARNGAVVYTDLSGVHDLPGVCREIADALDLALMNGGAIEHRERIARSFAARGRTILIADDVDTMIELARETFGLWLEAAADLRIVVTSRRALALPGESTITIAPLGPIEGRALFVDRASAALRRPLSPNEAEDASIDAIVAALDGLPLAIELASARAALATPSQIHALLERPLDVLSDSKRPIERHRSLRAAIEQSWAELDAPLRQALGRCSLFDAPFTLEVAADALSADPDVTRRRIAALDLLRSLVERSLVHVVSEDEPSDRRFRVLASIRELARERSEDEAGESARAEAVLARAEALLAPSHASSAALRALLRETRELTSVFARALSDRRIDHAVRALSALGRGTVLRGPSAAFLGWAKEIEPFASIDPRHRADLATWIARVWMTVGDFPQAIAISERALELERQLGRTSHAAAIAARLAMLHHYVGDDASADARFAELPEIDGLEPYHATFVLFCRGMILQRRDRRDEARPFFERALALTRAHGLREQEGKAIGQLAWCDFGARRLPEARSGFEEASVVLEEMCEARMSVAFAADVGLVLLEEGALDAARRRLGEAIEAHRRLTDRWLEADFHGYLGCLELIDRRSTHAQRCFAAAAALHHTTRDQRRLALLGALDALASAELGHLDAAERALDSIAGLDETDPLLRVARARIALARSGEQERARELCASLSTSAVHEHRFVARVLLAALERPSTELVVQASGGRVHGGSFDVHLDGIAARRLVARLAQCRVATPGEPLPIEALFDAGWPDERASARTRKNRVRVTLARLRRAGLRDLIVARPEGYLFDPSIPLRIG